MSEEILQRGLNKIPEKIGKWDFYNIGSTSIKALKSYNIINDIDYGTIIERKKVDGIIVFQKDVIAIIENKTPRQFNTKAKQNRAIEQEIKVAKKINCPIIIATDTQQTIWINSLTGSRILDENAKPVSKNWNPVEVTKDENLVALIERIISSIDKENNQIIAQKFVNPTDLAKQIWQDIWSVSGATPENCLYTFVELFIFKYLSDLKILKTPYNFDFLMKMYENSTEDDVLEHYAETIRNKIKKLFPYNPIDKTTIINGTIFVSKDQKSVSGYSAVFKKVLNKFRDYGKLENINHDFKSQLFESFLKESISKKNWGQFFTPIKIIRAIEKMASSDIREGITICDPACGVGKFLLEPIRSKLDDFYDITNGKVIPKITIRGFDKGFDKDEQKTIILAKANMLIYFSDLIKENVHLTKEFSNLFNKTFNLKTNSILGTLSEPIENEYDLILTNPPYVTSGSSNLKEEITKNTELDNYYKINGIGVEGLFMEWIVRALKPNGKAFVIVPDGLFNRRNDARLRQFIKDECFIDAVISLPNKTFFSTPKKTYILVITKKQNKTQQIDPVFTYLVSEIGESRDSYRFDIEKDDLSEAVNLFNQFKGSKQHYKNNDDRCKILDISLFDNLDNWIIENYWSNEEKIALGVLEESKAIQFEEFPSLLEEISINILSLKEELSDLVGEKRKQHRLKKKVTIDDIFDLSIKTNNSKFTKTFINSHKGEIPVYSASKFPKTVDYGYVKNNLIGIKYFEDCLTWNIDGSIGKIHFRKRRFSLSEKVIPLILKDDLQNFLDINFLKNTIENEFSKHSFGFENKASKGKIKHIEIQIPVNQNGEFDLKAQQEIAEKYQKIEDVKQKIASYKKRINELNVEVLLTESTYIDIPITDNKYFILQRGKRITRATINSNKGEIPVYSSSKDESSTLGSISENFLISNRLTLCTKPSILFNLDGSVGFCFIRNDKKYSFIDVVASITPARNNIDLEFLLYKLREEILKTGANYQTKLYFNKIANYDIKVKIPIFSDGSFDIEKQKEIAEKYQKIENITQLISVELYKIKNTIIDL